MLDNIDMAIAQLQRVRELAATSADTSAQLNQALADAAAARVAADQERDRFIGLRDQLISAVTALTTQLQGMN